MTSTEPIDFEDLFAQILTATRDCDEQSLAEKIPRLAAACGTTPESLRGLFADAAADPAAAQDLSDDLQTMAVLMAVVPPRPTRTFNFTLPEQGAGEDALLPGYFDQKYGPADLGTLLR